MEFRTIGKEYGFKFIKFTTQSDENGKLLHLELHFKKYISVFQQSLILGIYIDGDLIIDQKQIIETGMTKQEFMEIDNNLSKKIIEMLLTAEAEAINRRVHNARQNERN